MTLTALLILLALPDGPSFAEVTERSGIAFVASHGSRQKDWITEVNGSGVALFDYDADGDLDIYFVNGSISGPGIAGKAPGNVLYRNDGDWRFRDVTRETGVGDTGWGHGTAVADVDNDGDLDLYVTNRGPNVLYLNRGDGTFERARDSGAEDAGWGSCACFADFDGDGLVDLFVANYIDRFQRVAAKRRGSPDCTYKGKAVFCGPGGLKPAHDVLLLNAGGGRFRDASEAWGLRRVEPGFGLGALVVDIGRDGRPDLLVANDTQANFLFLNAGGRRFQEAALFLGLAYNDYGVAQAGMGLASGDVRGLGRTDIFVTNFEDDTNTLYLVGSDGRFFMEGTFPAGLGGPSYRHLGWGTFCFDAEGDGDLDLFVANGHVMPQMDEVRSSPGYRQRNQLFVNDGRGTFREAKDAGLTAKESSRGAACGDLDGDGDPDIVVTNMDGRPTLLENRSAPATWLAVRLRGGPSNRAAIGARVVLAYSTRRAERTIQSGMSYASQCELAARFALGDTEKVDAIEVFWPSGLVETFPGFPCPRPVHRVTLVEGSGKLSPKR